MKTPIEGKGAQRWCAALLLVLLLGLPAYARVFHGEAWGRERFAAAEQIRESLNGRVATERTRRDYQRVIDAYRRVYFGAPACSKADPSVAAVAELLMEMGRRFDDEKILRSAIDEFSFLRREYPASKYRFDALFTSAEIYKDDLNDPRQARSAFEEFLRRYPRHHLADDARQALKEISQETKKKEKPAGSQAAKRAEEARTGESEKPDSAEDTDDEQDNIPAKPGKVARITGIRHWSTPDYTRVAIDLEENVRFESQRIDHPDRIYFDLTGTRLASTLAGKSIDVDDEFLKKIRIAQFKPGKTRVVLEVNELANYKAALLPNPYRLIIDLRGKSDAAETQRGILGIENHVKPREVESEPIKDAQTAPQTPGAEAEIHPQRETLAKAQSSSVAASARAAQPTVAPGRTPPVKKIVEADDDDEETPKIAALEPADLRPEITSSEKASIPAPNSGKHAKSDTNAGGRDRPEGAASDRDSSASATLDGGKPVHGSHRTKHKSSATAEIDVREAKPTAAGDRSLIRALGLKIGKIVIDPGHGGHDTGTIGPNGLEEKDLVLGVAKRLGKLLEARMGAEVIYTRQDDTFIPLETRTAIANQEQADLFVSIHANSSSDPDARGVETYYLNFTSNADALEVAARENAVSDKSIHELQDLVKKIALKEKIEESREFASDVQHALHTGLAAKSPAIRDRGVKKAPFIVLIGANMPSILAEISFVSNPTDEHKLETAEYRQRIAESLYRGISKYVSGLSGMRVASRMAKSEGQ